MRVFAALFAIGLHDVVGFLVRRPALGLRDRAITAKNRFRRNGTDYVCTSVISHFRLAALLSNVYQYCCNSEGRLRRAISPCLINVFRHLHWVVLVVVFITKCSVSSVTWSRRRGPPAPLPVLLQPERAGDGIRL